LHELQEGPQTKGVILPLQKLVCAHGLQVTRAGFVPISEEEYSDAVESLTELM